MGFEVIELLAPDTDEVTVRSAALRVVVKLFIRGNGLSLHRVSDFS